jgi:WD40 repeat protein
MTLGRRLGDYELLEVLGRGSFGTVWEARHVTLDRLSAIKVLNRLPLGERHSERFLREAQITASLRHPHIVNVLEVGKAQEDGQVVHYLVYELIEGVTLSDWARFAELGHREIAELIFKLASAAQHAHERGIVHRDLKPENILVDLSGSPHITDFGMARKLDDRLTAHNVTLGTVAYMSPEQARGESGAVDGRSDVFSLGVILFELLTKHLPFDGKSIPSYVAQVAGMQAPSPRATDSSIPRDLETICLKCLRNSRDERYDSAAALEQDLRRFQEGRPILARPVGPLARLRRWCLRQPMAAALLGLLAMMAIVGPLFALRQATLRRELAAKTDVLAMTIRSLRSTQYSTDRFFAYQAWSQHRLPQMREILDRSVPGPEEVDLRDFAWYLLNDRVDSVYQVAAKSAQPIYQCCLTDDSRYLVIADASDQVSVWDFKSRRKVRTIRLLSDAHHAIAMFGDAVLIGDRQDGKPFLCSYDLHSGRRLRSIPLSSRNTIESIRVSTDGTRIAVGTRYEGIHLLDAKQDQVLFLPNLGRHDLVEFSPDGQYLVAAINDHSGGYQGVVLWTVADGQIVRQRQLPFKLRGLAWRPDGEYLAVVGEKDEYTHLLRFSDLETAAQLRHDLLQARSLDFDPDDGKTLVVSSEDGSLVVQYVTFEPASLPSVAYRPHVSEITSVRYVGEGKILTTGLDGTTVVSCPACLLSQGASVLSTVQERSVMAYSAARNSLLIGDRGGILWNEHGQRLRQFEHGISAIEFHPNGSVACGLSNGTIAILDAKDHSTLQTFRLMLGDRAVNAIKFYADGDYALIGGGDSQLRIWSLRDGRVLWSHRFTDSILSIAMCDDSELAFASGPFEQIHAVDLTQQRLAFKLGTGTSKALLMHPSRRLLLSAHDDSNIRIWDLDTQTLETIFRGHEGRVNCLALHANGNILATGDGQGVIRLWDLALRAEIGVVYQTSPEIEIDGLAFPQNEIALVALIRQEGVKSQVIRIGLP